MKVLETSIMPNGTDIQIEEWNETYDFVPFASNLVAYPISKASHSGTWSPKGNEKFRCSFQFKSSNEAKTAYENLKTGKKQLVDYLENLENKKYSDCI